MELTQKILILKFLSSLIKVEKSQIGSYKRDLA